MLRLLVCLLVLLSTSFAQSNPKNVSADISKLEKKVVALRQPDKTSMLRFNSDGTLLGERKPGTWITSALIYVNSVKKNDAQVTINGVRCLVFYDRKQKRLVPMPRNQKEVAVEISVAGPTQADFDNAMRSVFETGVAQSLIDYWQSKFDASKDWSEAAKTIENPIGTLAGRPVYRVASGEFSAPKPISTPNADYPESARMDRKQGKTTLNVIVDENGDVALIALKGKPKTELDVAALDAVTQWRFKPALLNNKPIAVLIGVEMNFQLY